MPITRQMDQDEYHPEQTTDDEVPEDRVQRDALDHLAKVVM